MCKLCREKPCRCVRVSCRCRDCAGLTPGGPCRCKCHKLKMSEEDKREVRAMRRKYNAARRRVDGIIDKIDMAFMEWEEAVRAAEYKADKDGLYFEIMRGLPLEYFEITRRLPCE